MPEWLTNYDLVAPLTAVPLGALRSQFPLWQTERAWRALCMLPFLFGAVPEDWRDKGERLATSLSVPSLFLFVPHPDRYSLQFSEGSAEDWGKESASALWDFHTSRVLWAEGIHTRDSLREQGKTFKELFGDDAEK